MKALSTVLILTLLATVPALGASSSSARAAALFQPAAYLGYYSSPPGAAAGTAQNPYPSTSDERLSYQVREALRNTIDSSTVDVAARNGNIYLGGIVGSTHDKDLAYNTAQSVPGVSHVYTNDLQVGPLQNIGAHGHAAADERLSDRVFEALVRTPDVDASGIAVTAQNGNVYLSGTVPSTQQRDLAQNVAGSVQGAGNVYAGNLQIAQARSVSSRTDENLKGRVYGVLQSALGDRASQIDVDVENGNVRLSGAVPSQRDKNLAREATDSVRGVRQVFARNLRIAPGSAPSAYYPYGYRPVR